MMKAEEARVKNVVEIALMFSAMARVFERGSTSRIRRVVEETLAKLQEGVVYNKCHDEFCRWFTQTIKNAKTKRAASWGQAAKVIDVALKVCVYYCHLPSEEMSQRIVPMLNAAIDTPLLKDLKRRHRGFSGISTLAAIDRRSYEKLQETIRLEIKQLIAGRVFPVEYDDMKWRELNRDDE